VSGKCKSDVAFCLRSYVYFFCREKKGLSKEETGDLIIDMIKGVGKQIKSESKEIDIKRNILSLELLHATKSKGK